MSEILKLLSEPFNTVIIDSPPTLLVTKEVALAQRVDGVLLVVRSTVSKWASLRQAIKLLQLVYSGLL